MWIGEIRSTQSQEKEAVQTNSITHVSFEVHKDSMVMALAGIKDHYRRNVE
jgi:hypothetical protein